MSTRILGSAAWTMEPRRAQVLGGLIVIGATAFVPSQAQVRTSALQSFRVVIVAEGLENPWSMAFLPNGDMLVTELAGRLRIVRDGRLLPNPVPGVPRVQRGDAKGLLEIVLHPDFASNHLIYLSICKPSADGSQDTVAVVRGRFENEQLSDMEEVFEADAWSDTRGNHGGRMVFDHAGFLFVSVGDRQAPPVGNLEAHPAQDNTNHFGTIVRLKDDGSVPQDNPFVDQAQARPEIWSYGHRNPQGLTIHQETGDLWATDHGPQGGDELNHVRRGLNYGWPVIGYGANYRSGLPIHSTRERGDMEQPAAFWVPSMAPSGLIIYTANRFPKWQGNAFVGGLSDQHRHLSRVVLEGTRVTTREALLHGEMRIRDVRQGPDGYIYIAIDDRGGSATAIVRLEPVD